VEANQFLLFVYICITVGDPGIKRVGLGSCCSIFSFLYSVL